MAVSRMRNKKYAIWPLLMAKTPKFLHLTGNRGQRTRAVVGFFTGSRNMAISRMRDKKYAIWRGRIAYELRYGADTMFPRTYFCSK